MVSSIEMSRGLNPLTSQQVARKEKTTTISVSCRLLHLSVIWIIYYIYESKLNLVVYLCSRSELLILIIIKGHSLLPIISLSKFTVATGSHFSQQFDSEVDRKGISQIHNALFSLLRIDRLPEVIDGSVSMETTCAHTFITSQSTSRHFL